MEIAIRRETAASIRMRAVEAEDAAAEPEIEAASPVEAAQ
jgi:hypothetical protein